jgi:LacI family transcriptional regulator
MKQKAKEPVLGPVSKKLYDQLASEILEGKLRPGDFLPSVQGLCSRHAVSIDTACRALKKLQADKLVSVVGNKGYRVLDGIDQRRVKAPAAYVLDHPQQNDAFFNALFAAVQDAAHRRGLSMLSVNAGSRQVDEVLEELRRVGAFGLVLDSTRQELIDGAKRLGLPALMVDSWVPGCGLDDVMQDGPTGGSLAVEYLVGRGRRRIAWLGPVNSNAHVMERIGGAMAGLKAHGLELSPDLTFAADLAGRHDAAARLFSGKKRPEAVLALWHSYAIAAKQAADAQGLVIGRDFDLVGWCAEELLEDVYRPAFGAGPLPPTVTWSIRAMAEAAVCRLLERRAQAQLPPLRIKVPVTLRLQ